MLYQPHQRLTLRPQPRRFQFDSFFKEWIRPLLIILAVGITLNLFFPRYYVKGHSMDPSLNENDWLVTSSLDTLDGMIERGSIVTATNPKDGVQVIKRVIGLPGELIEIRRGTVYINGELLVEDYINEEPRYNKQWLLEDDQYILLGDNRNRSLDSADYGPVQAHYIHSVVKARLWPLNSAGIFALPDYNLSQLP